MTSTEAHAEAIRRIRKAKEEGGEILDLGDLRLEKLPDELGQLASLRVLALGWMKPVIQDSTIKWEAMLDRPIQGFLDLTTLWGLSELSSLSLCNHWAVSNLVPLSDLSTLTSLDLRHCTRV